VTAVGSRTKVLTKIVWYLSFHKKSSLFLFILILKTTLTTFVFYGNWSIN